tara:strand:- start:1734 stop:2411 length:678 start_codon:yes stop_codon:yes gene_type:complete
MKESDIKILLPKDWKNELKKNTSLTALNKPLVFIRNQIIKNKIVCPPYMDIFNAFKHCSLSSTKVIIFGQDPYFQEGVANGLAFSVDDNQPIPASLKNIYKEIKNDVGKSKNTGGCLRRWSHQGVLLLNSSLSVEVSKPGSHSKIGWEDFILEILNILKQKNHLVYMLWGSHAKKYYKFIDHNKNLVLKASHPSPLSASRGFFGSKHFSKCNRYLKKQGLKKIIW